MLASTRNNIIIADGTCEGVGELVEPVLPLARYRFSFSYEQPPRLPRFTGSAWRGALGWALRRAVCVTGRSECAGCILDGSCVYPYLFETRPPPEAVKMRRYRSVPRPFALEVNPEGDSLSSGAITLGLTVFGRANRLLPILAHALRQAGRSGIGGQRNILQLDAIVQETHPGTEKWCAIGGPDAEPHPVPPRAPPRPTCPGEVLIRLHTPMRFKRGGHNVTPDSFEPADLFGNLLRRVSMLTYFHTDTPLETDFAALKRLARSVRWRQRSLEWRDWTRYSSRQATELRMGGLTGRLVLDMAGLEALWPYLWLGQWVHVGKGTTMGLGRYSVRVAASS